MKKPKILILDIETSLSGIAAFSLRPQYHNYKNILSDWWIHTAAWKFVGDKKIGSVKCYTPHADKTIVKKLRKVILQADVIVGHNIDKFDLKKINSRLLAHGEKPLTKPVTIDTLKVARKHFALISNKLDYIAGLLGVPTKASSGVDMWLGALRGDKKSVDAMEKYNKQDIVVQEAVYKKLKPFIATPNLNAFSDKLVCPSCGSPKVFSKGYIYTSSGKYPRKLCKDCGHGFRLKKSVATFDGRS